MNTEAKERRRQKRAKQLVMQPRFRNRTERDRKSDYQRRPKHGRWEES